MASSPLFPFFLAPDLRISISFPFLSLPLRVGRSSHVLAVVTLLEFEPFCFPCSFSSRCFSCHIACRVSFDSSRLFRDKPASYRRMQIFVGLTGFRLASYRSVGMGCGAPYLRSISQNFLDGFCTPLSCLHLHIIQPFKVGLCHDIHYLVSSLISRSRVSDENPPAFRTL